MLKGLKAAGADVSQADLLVGTSSGAILAAHLASGETVDGVYDAIIATASAAAAAAAAAPAFDADYVEQIRALVRNAKELTPELRMDVGRRALAATKVLSEDAHIRQIAVQSLGDVRSWPARSLKIAAVDVVDGTVRFFDSTQGVSIERAAAASNAGAGRVAPITIGDRRYIDGYTGGANVEGAAGTRLILVLAPNPHSSLTTEVERVRAKGSKVLDLSPDTDARTAMGTDNADVTKRAPAAQTGLRQAATVAAQVKALWA